MEAGWAESIRGGEAVHVTIEPLYGSDSLRPGSSAVRDRLGDARLVTRFFHNKPGG